MTDHDTPTPAQIEQARREAEAPPFAYWLTLAIALVAACAASVLLPWGFSGGVTLP